MQFECFNNSVNVMQQNSSNVTEFYFQILDFNIFRISLFLEFLFIPKIEILEIQEFHKKFLDRHLNIYVCMYVCRQKNMRINLCVYVGMSLGRHAWVCMYVCMLVCLNTCTTRKACWLFAQLIQNYDGMCMWRQIHILCTCIYICMYVCISVYT